MHPEQKEYWIHHLRKLAADNAKLNARNRELEKLIRTHAEELKHYQSMFIEQNARILTLSIEIGKNGNCNE